MDSCSQPCSEAALVVPMSVTRKGEYFLLSTHIPLDEELSELEDVIPEPAPLHKRNVQGRLPGSFKSSSYRPRGSEIQDDGRPSRTRASGLADGVPGIGMRQDDRMRWNAIGLDYRRSSDAEETVKCIISSVLFLVIVVTVVVVAIVKNPEM